MRPDPPIAPHSTRPELMAPAGDWDCARAAVENGADAVYFGLRGGFNARARAANFDLAELPELLAFLHVRGVKGYLTLNTLVFRDELEQAEQAARAAIAAGVDAVLVQDLGLARLLVQLCPSLPLHASTQMTLSSAECIAEVQSLGIRRVVLPRELSIDDIAAIRRQTAVELEAFVHGSLCISYSGQCLASLGLGGRSANRGQCAQPCRLPYQLVVEPPSQGSGVVGTMVYPMSPLDLAAHDRLDRLIAAGVSALKIEGRLKPAEYVAGVTRFYRAQIDAAAAASGRASEASGRGPAARGGGRPESRLPTPDSELSSLDAFSRGSCRGWLDGRDDQALVSGASSAKRGVYLGQIERLRDQRVTVRLAAPIRRGDGVVFEGDRSRGEEIGGRVYEIFQQGRSIKGPVAEGLVELAFRYGTIASARLSAGQKVWKTDEPQLRRRLQQTYAGGRCGRRVPVDIVVEAAVGRPLVVSAAAATGAAGRVESPEVLQEAVKHPLTVETLTGQFGRLGGTPFQLRRLEAKLDGRPMCPLSVLAAARHEMVEQLLAAASQPPKRDVAEAVGWQAEATLRPRPSPEAQGVPPDPPKRDVAEAVGWRAEATLRPGPSPGAQNVPPARSQLHVLCRRPEQIDVALACGVSSLIADFPDPQANRAAVRAARKAGATILLATPRIQRPRAEGSPLPLAGDGLPGALQSRQSASPLPLAGDGLPGAVSPRLFVSPLPLAGEGLGVRARTADAFQRLADENPHGLLVRNLAGLGFCRRAGLPAVADFSLNAVNDLSFDWLCRQGACRVTAAYDLNGARLLDLASAVEPGRLEVIVEAHLPLFHTEYCLFCRVFQGSRHTPRVVGNGPGGTPPNPSEGRPGGTPLSPSEGRGVSGASGRATPPCGQPCRQYNLRLRDRYAIEHPVSVDADCRTTVFHAGIRSLADAVPELLARGVRHYRIELLAQPAGEARRTIEAYRKLW